MTRGSLARGQAAPLLTGRTNKKAWPVGPAQCPRPPCGCGLARHRYFGPVFSRGGPLYQRARASGFAAKPVGCGVSMAPKPSCFLGLPFTFHRTWGPGPASIDVYGLQSCTLPIGQSLSRRHGAVLPAVSSQCTCNSHWLRERTQAGSNRAPPRNMALSALAPSLEHLPSRRNPAKNSHALAGDSHRFHSPRFGVHAQTRRPQHRPRSGTNGTITVARQQYTPFPAPLVRPAEVRRWWAISTTWWRRGSRAPEDGPCLPDNPVNLSRFPLLSRGSSSPGGDMTIPESSPNDRIKLPSWSKSELGCPSQPSPRSEPVSWQWITRHRDDGGPIYRRRAGRRPQPI